MAQVRVMYWKEIPVQVQARDTREQVSATLDDRFQQAVDTVAMVDGSVDGDAYVASWEWGPFIETPGTAREAADLVVEQYNRCFPAEIVGLVAALERSGRRDPRPGALDHFLHTAGPAGQPER